MYTRVDASCRAVRTADVVAEGIDCNEFEALRSLCSEARTGDSDRSAVNEREWFNGRIFPSQGRDAGSIPVSRSIKFLRDCVMYTRIGGSGGFV